MSTLEGIRITLIAYTASFRVPSFVGHQLTLAVPPLSTIFGLLSAAAGRWILPQQVKWLAYRCEYAGKATDLEAIVTVERKKPSEDARFVGRNVLDREFLTLPCLTLYLPPEWAAPFQRPRYTLLLGRTQDVASVQSMTPVTLEPVDQGMVNGVLLPWELVKQNHVPSLLHNLPIGFTEDPERRLLGMKIFGVVDAKQRLAQVQTPGWLVRDTDSDTVMPFYRQEWITDVVQRTVSEVG
jgi:CRISPR-associated protein Cas5t